MRGLVTFLCFHMVLGVALGDAREKITPANVDVTIAEYLGATLPSDPVYGKVWTATGKVKYYAPNPDDGWKRSAAVSATSKGQLDITFFKQTTAPYVLTKGEFNGGVIFGSRSAFGQIDFIAEVFNTVNGISSPHRKVLEQAKYKTVPDVQGFLKDEVFIEEDGEELIVRKVTATSEQTLHFFRDQGKLQRMEAEVSRLRNGIWEQSRVEFFFD